MNIDPDDMITQAEAARIGFGEPGCGSGNPIAESVGVGFTRARRGTGTRLTAEHPRDEDVQRDQPVGREVQPERDAQQQRSGPGLGERTAAPAVRSRLPVLLEVARVVVIPLLLFLV